MSTTEQMKRSWRVSLTVAVLTQVFLILAGYAALDRGYLLKAVLITVPFFWLVPAVACLLSKKHPNWLHYWLRYSFIPTLFIVPVTAGITAFLIAKCISV